jgi:hypothetical protein
VLHKGDIVRTYSFQTLDNPADPTFNQLLGVNDAGLIAGFYGSGQPGHPNQGYLLDPPSSYTPVDFPGVARARRQGRSFAASASQLA